MLDTELLEGTERYTRVDYMELPEGFPAYLLDGFLVREASPTHWHQWVTLALYRRALACAPGRVLVSPIDVVIDDWNVLQPDVAIFPAGVRAGIDTDPDSLPLVVIEVLSPRTARRDSGPKTDAYLRGGVVEVWLVDPQGGGLEVVTRGGRTAFAPDETATSAALSGFALSWADVDRERRET